MFNFLEEMWMVQCSKEDVLPVVENFLTEKVMGS